MSLFAFPVLRTELLQQTKKVPAIASLWKRFDKDTVNVPKTLPAQYKTKSEINGEVAAANVGSSLATLQFKSTVAFAKAIIKFYKTGVSKVYNNKKEVKSLLKNHKLTHINSKGKEIDIRIPDFQKLTNEFAQAIYMDKIERSSKSESSVVRHEESLSPLFNFSRYQYQLMRRTKQDFYKIPMFGVVFFIFMEFTPIVCYAFPNIAPLTCIIPSMLLKVWHPQGLQVLKDKVADLAIKNAYNLPLEDVRTLSKNLNLVSRYLPIWIYPESYLRNKLQDYHNYLTVDNFFLAGYNDGGNIWNLEDKELQVACLERNMVNDIEGLSNADMDVLRLRLFRFVVDFEENGIGYLKAQHGLDDVNKEMISWRETE